MWSSPLSSGLFFPLTLLFTFVTAGSKYNNRLNTTATNAGPLTIVFTLAASCAIPRTVANYGYPYLLPGCEGPYGQNYCAKSFNTISTMTYVDATLSTQLQDLRFTASPIQIRFKTAQSTIVPVPTDSLSLLRRFLYTREKIGIGIGVPVAVALLTIGGG
ncbi:hypothetical protein N7467_005629 [Penicillium canescens]|nr:hypothetical protein N7467_005629 [Penicillium canescens]